MEVNSGCIIKDLRIKYGIKQRELECEGLERSVISKLERGIKEVKASHTQKLAKQFNLVGKRKNITFDCEITSDLLLGRKENDIDRLVSNFKNGYQYALFEIDEFLAVCTPKLGEDLTTKLVDELVENIKKYSEETKEYCMKLLEYTNDKVKRTETYINLIAAHFVGKYSDKYEVIASLVKRFESDVPSVSKRKKISFYSNVSTAYRNLNKHKEALILIKKGKKIKDNPHLFGLLNTEAIIYTDLKKYKMAEGIYDQIIEKSNNVNDIANSYANRADIYNTKGELDLAEKYLSKAFEYFGDISVHYKYNLMYIKLQLEIKQKKDIFNTLKTCFEFCREIGRVKSEKPLKLAIDYYVEFNTNELNNIIELLFNLKIETKATLLMDILPYITNEHIRKKAYQISRY